LEVCRGKFNLLAIAAGVIMFLDALEQYQDIISSYDVLQFRMVGASYQLIAEVYLSNQTELHVKDYLFLDGARKYFFL
jgi:hypothetical protein